MNLKSIINEVLDTMVSDYEIKVKPYSRNISVYFNVDKEKYVLNFYRDVEINELVTIDFERWGGDDKGWNLSPPKGKEHNPAKILGSIVNLIKLVLEKYSDIHFLTFNTNDSNGSRVRLYDAIVNMSVNKGIVKQADRNSEIYKSIIENYPKSWLLEVIR